MCPPTFKNWLEFQEAKENTLLLLCTLNKINRAIKTPWWHHTIPVISQMVEKLRTDGK